jgi:ketosteroid isomerase-like protein
MQTPHKAAFWRLCALCLRRATQMGENAAMSKQQAKLHAVMGGTPDEVETAFYEALQRGDIDQLMACWADEDDIACIHPGGGRVSGAGAIRASFEAMFALGGGIPVALEQVRRVDSLASAVHHVLEKVQILAPDGPASAHVIATNVYHKTPQGWRLVVHHASPGTPDDTAHPPHEPQVLH